MDLDLGADIEMRVSYRGQTHVMREPTVSQVERFKDSNEIIPFLVELGLPQDVAENLPLSKVELLTKSILDTITKKK